MNRKKEMYKAVLFDLYGTLIDLKTDESNPELWEKLKIYYQYGGAVYTGEELEEKYKEFCGKEIKKIKGTQHPDIDILKVFKALYKYKGVSPTKVQIETAASFFRILSTVEIKLYEGVIELLELLKSEGVKIILLSNAQRSFTINELKACSIYNYFDSLYISSDYNISKPDAEFYNTVLKKESLDKIDVIMIGNDHTTDIAGANNSGIDSVYIHTNHSRKEALEMKDTLKCNLFVENGRILEAVSVLR